MAVGTWMQSAVMTLRLSENNNATYHVGIEGRGELLSIQIVPVNGGEKHVVLDLIL